jgi:S-adenosyl-L-methionine hydrolase (adenosine-forming)
MAVLTLTTDFGLANGFVGVMKGVIYAIAPEVNIVDISHLVSPQNLRAGALTMWRAVPYFPAGSVHVGVVDPGVGTQRRPLGAQLGDQFFIAPDNGLLTPMIRDAEQRGVTVRIIHLTNPKFWLPKISNTFHGRDIFAPAGAHLAAGVPLGELGIQISDPVRIDLPHPEKKPGGWTAHVAIIDVFGNITTDLPAQTIVDQPGVVIRLRGVEVDGLVESYGHRPDGEIIALEDSEGFLEIAQVNGNAAVTLGARVDDEVEIIINVGGL